MGDSQANSLCAVYAMLIEEQLRSDDPDMDLVYEQLRNIKQYCSTMSFPPGETPEHLEDYLYEEGDADGRKGVPTPGN